jgi:hypothetical protein
MESCPSEVTLGTYVTQETRTNNEDILWWSVLLVRQLFDISKSVSSRQ